MRDAPCLPHRGRWISAKPKDGGSFRVKPMAWQWDRVGEGLKRPPVIIERHVVLTAPWRHTERSSVRDPFDYARYARFAQDDADRTESNVSATAQEHRNKTALEAVPYTVAIG